MKIGYLKNISDITSTNEIISNMEKEDVEKIIVEVINNKENCQYMLLSIIETMTSNDILVIQSLDALIGETLADIINIIKKLDEKQIDIQVLEKSFSSLEKNDSSNYTILRKQLLIILQWLDQWLKNKEKDYLKKRKLDSEKLISSSLLEKGSGRPKKYSNYAKNPKDREVYLNVIDMLKNDIPIKRISEKLKISRNTIYKIKDEMDTQTNIVDPY